MEAVGKEAPRTQEQWCERAVERPGPAHACPFRLSTHWAVPAALLVIPTAWRGRQRLSKYRNTALLLCLYPEWCGFETAACRC